MFHFMEQTVDSINGDDAVCLPFVIIRPNNPKEQTKWIEKMERNTDR